LKGFPYPQNLRRNVILTSLVAAVVGLIAVLAVADAVRSGSSSTSTSAAPTSTDVSTVQKVSTASTLSTEQEVAFPPDGLTQEQRIEWIGNRWAVLFAAGPLPAACRYETQPLCERLACERVGGGEIRNCMPPTSAFRNSFFGATVQEVEIRSSRAAARFSNGVVVELFGDGGTWSIRSLGGNAGHRFFE
jgi:hypothetical protein